MILFVVFVRDRLSPLVVAALALLGLAEAVIAVTLFGSSAVKVYFRSDRPGGDVPRGAG
jgi:hypothetical protein